MTATGEPCTTEAKRKRHYSIALADVNDMAGGRRGRTLCGGNGQDEARVNGRFRYYGSTRRIRIADLPACAICARIVQAG